MSRSRTRPRAPGRLRDNRSAIVGLTLVVGLVLAAVMAPLLSPHDPYAVDMANRFAPPSTRFPLGTDEVGRDILSRLLFGARLSIGATFVAAAAISVLGLALGLVAGYFGGAIDTLVGRTIDVLLAFPAFLLALAITAAAGPGLVTVTIAVVVAGWAGYARVVRAAVVAQRERPYVEAARAVGASNARVLGRHVLPNVVGPMVVLTALQLGTILLSLSALSFLGLGVRPPAPEWGAMLAEAKAYLGPAPTMMVFPGAAIFLLVLGCSLLGDGLRDVLAPRGELTRHAVSRESRARDS